MESPQAARRRRFSQDSAAFQSVAAALMNTAVMRASASCSATVHSVENVGLCTYQSVSAERWTPTTPAAAARVIPLLRAWRNFSRRAGVSLLRRLISTRTGSGLDPQRFEA